MLGGIQQGAAFLQHGNSQLHLHAQGALQGGEVQRQRQQRAFLPVEEHRQQRTVAAQAHGPQLFQGERDGRAHALVGLMQPLHRAGELCQQG